MHKHHKAIIFKTTALYHCSIEDNGELPKNLIVELATVPKSKWALRLVLKLLKIFKNMHVMKLYFQTHSHTPFWITISPKTIISDMLLVHCVPLIVREYFSEFWHILTKIVMLLTGRNQSRSTTRYQNLTHGKIYPTIDRTGL